MDEEFKRKKINKLCQEWGYISYINMMKDYQPENMSPGICMNENCNFTDDVEHDQSNGFCEVCEEKTVASIFAIIGV